jgi:hypothetical protein
MGPRLVETTRTQYRDFSRFFQPFFKKPVTRGADGMGKFVIKTTKGLRLQGQRFRKKIRRIGEKISRNPHRGDLIPSLELVNALLEEQETLLKNAEALAKDQHQFSWDMYETKALLRDIHKISAAQRAISGG